MLPLVLLPPVLLRMQLRMMLAKTLFLLLRALFHR